MEYIATSAEIESLARQTVTAAINVHIELGGPGLVESAYEEALEAELKIMGLTVERQVACPLMYKGQRLTTILRLDLLVGGKLIVECKAVDKYNPIFECQLLTYLRMTGQQLGLVINFGERLVKNGIRMVINSLPAAHS